ncbi:Ribonuclease, partial [Globisporangium polare]
VASATAQINTWAAEDNEAPSKEAIEALFPKRV